MASSRLPLQGLVIYDFTRHLAGPFATMILRDLGARVIKFEPPRGDPARTSGPYAEGDSAYFHPINRGKESVVVDLRNEDDVARVTRILGGADVLVESFRPGVMDKIGLGHKAVRSANPRLIYASCSGFGADGPYAGRPAFDVVVQAMGGVMSVTGHPDGPPTRVGVSQGDLLAGIYAALGVLAALTNRGETGEGAYVDISMFEAQMALATHAFGIRAATGKDPHRIGNRHPATAPFDAYPTADGHVAIGTVEDASFIRMCDALDMDDVRDDPNFGTREQRLDNVEALTDAITRHTKQRSTNDVVSRLLAAQVPVGPVLGIGDVIDDEHVAARGSLLHLTSWGSDGLPVPTLPFKVDGRRWVTDERGPELGSLTLEVLEKELRKHR